MKTKKKNRHTRVSPFEVVLYAIMIAFMACIIFPFLNVISISLSDEVYVMTGQVGIWPKGFNLNTYKYIFSDGSFFRAYANTILYTVLGTGIALITTAMGAYALSRKRMVGQKFFSIMITITMFFGGGMIPSYLTISSYGLIDSMWALILPAAVSTWNLIVMRSFFVAYPKEIIESGQLDGLPEAGVFFRLVLPTSKAVLATIGLYYAVSFWNSYIPGRLYLRSEEKYPVQMLLRDLLVTPIIEGIETEDQVVAASVRNSAIVVTILPIMCVYPFLQRYFVKGTMVGSIKG